MWNIVEAVAGGVTLLLLLVAVYLILLGTKHMKKLFKLLDETIDDIKDKDPVKRGSTIERTELVAEPPLLTGQVEVMTNSQYNSIIEALALSAEYIIIAIKGDSYNIDEAGIMIRDLKVEDEK